MPDPIKVEDYLKIEQTAHDRNELYEGVLYKLPVTNPNHNSIKFNCFVEIGLAIKGNSGYYSYSTTQRVSIPEMSFYGYPDVLVVGGRSEIDPLDRDTIKNPLLICEVFSLESEFYDSEIKLKIYQAASSIKEYVLVNSYKREIKIWRRRMAGSWEMFTANDFIELKSIGISIPVSDIYSNTDF